MKDERSSAAPAGSSHQSGVGGTSSLRGVGLCPERQRARTASGKDADPPRQRWAHQGPWSTANIVAGQVTKVEIERHHAAADIIVILVSADLLADCTDCWRGPSSAWLKAPPLFLPSCGRRCWLIPG